jgi:hypothetical protein
MSRASTIKRSREESEEREIKRVKYEKDTAAHLSQYADFKQEEQGADVVKTEENSSPEVANYEEFKCEEMGPISETDVKEEEKEDVESESGLEEGEIVEDELRIEGRLADTIKALARGTL